MTGGTIYDRQIVEMLRGLGHTVRVNSLRKRCYYANILTNLTEINRIRNSPDLPDIILQDELTHPALFRFNSVAKNRGIPVVGIIHNLMQLSPEQPRLPGLQSKIETAYHRSLSGYIAVSKRTQSQVNRFLERPVPSLVAYPSGDRFSNQCDENEIIERTKRDNPLRMLYLGNITANKQLHMLLESLGRLEQRTAELIVVGRTDTQPEYFIECKRLVQRYDLQDRVDFTGAIPDTASLAKLIRDMDVLILPSKSEGFPLVIPEVAGFGVPAIVTTESAADEFIDHEANGFLLKPNDVDGLGRIISNLAGNRGYLAEMSLAALMRFRHHPTWADTGKNIAGFLEQIIGENL